MPIKSLLGLSGSYEIHSRKNEHAIELTLILDKVWAKQLGLPTNRFQAREPNTGLEQHEDWLEQKLWAQVTEAARPRKVSDYYYPAEILNRKP